MGISVTGVKPGSTTVTINSKNQSDHQQADSSHGEIP